MKELTYKDFEDYEQRLMEEAYYCMGDAISSKSLTEFESIVRCYVAMNDFARMLRIAKNASHRKRFRRLETMGA